ncbi:hypothetical protein B4U79_03769 [Dinothrombium tinctorium]|uniref:Uncharacterized protein n=1 Tax=Dinothrombium tinctorium TaxID=1965070 RepID=A0A443R5K1_9ACAR|nr:hypothetical protein B4U79_03769 [Dinothrombium tinctorium]
MVDLSGGGPEGPIEHRFSNWIFVPPAIITVALIKLFGMIGEETNAILEYCKLSG